MTYTKEDLKQMKLSQLWQTYTKLTGKATRSTTPSYVIRLILKAQDNDSQPDDPATTAAEPPVEGEGSAGDADPAKAAEAPTDITEAQETSDAACQAAEQSAFPNDDPTADVPPAQLPAPSIAERQFTNDEPTDEEPLPQPKGKAAQDDEPAKAGEEKSQRKWGEYTTDELRALYVETIGRPTGSTNRGYLIWKIREARKGNIPIGPRRRQSNPDAEYKVLPLRMEASEVVALDEAVDRLGYSSRTRFMREAVAEHLAAKGEQDAATALGYGQAS